MPYAVVVDWYGPYRGVDSFVSEMRRWTGGMRTLYMALGSGNVVRYVGSSTNPASRFYNHQKLRDKGNRRFFAGVITSQGITGPRPTARPPDLAHAEHILIRVLAPTLNEKLVGTDPDDCVSVFSRFFAPDDDETPINPLPKFPSLVGYNCWLAQYLSCKSPGT